MLNVATSQGNISIWDSQGEGRPVLLIHGNSACKEIFRPQIESPLGKKYRLLALDLPGHGQSDRATHAQETYNFDGYTAVVMEVIERLGLQRPAVVGWSLGGHIGLGLLQKSQQLAGLLITGTPPIKVSQEGFSQGFHPLPLFQTLFNKVEFTEDEATEFMSAAGFDIAAHPFIREAALKTDGYARRHLAESMMAGVGGDQKAIVESNETPLCVIQGANDRGINNDYIQSLNYCNLFNRKVYVIEGAGHAVFWEQPDQFNPILDQFLSSLT